MGLKQDRPVNMEKKEILTSIKNLMLCGLYNKYKVYNVMPCDVLRTEVFYDKNLHRNRRHGWYVAVDVRKPEPYNYIGYAVDIKESYVRLNEDEIKTFTADLQSAIEKMSAGDYNLVVYKTEEEVNSLLQEMENANG